MSEEYESLRFVNEKITAITITKLQILTILLCQQMGYTKHLCFLFLWDSRDRMNHHKLKNSSVKSGLISSSANVVNDPLVPERVLLPPLRIKLGIIKQLVKSFKGDGCFRYLQQKFPNKSEGKIKEGVFDGPKIRKLPDTEFIKSMNTEQAKTWISFKAKKSIKTIWGLKKHINRPLTRYCMIKDNSTPIRGRRGW